MDQTLAGTLAVVTGAARGIGAAVASALAARGARLAVTDIDRVGLDRVAPAIGARAYRLDVTDAEAVETVIGQIETELGAVGLLVNVAGVLHAGPVVSYSDDHWRDTFAVNTTGVFQVSRAVVGRMIGRRDGSVITVASNAAGVPRTGMAAYAASKAAAVMFTKCLGLETARLGIRCNIVSPGSTETEMLRSLWTDESGCSDTVDGSLDQFRTGIPLGRVAQAADVAEAVAFLASPQARHITMHDLYVDGGAAMRG